MTKAAAILAPILLIASPTLASAAPATVPPPAPDLRVRVDGPRGRTLVTRRGGCTTVQVCPGRAPRAQAPTPVPPPPPAPPAQVLPPPPPLAPAPNACRAPREAQAPRRGKAAQRKPLPDPARTHLALTDSAEVLGHGEWEVVSRGIVGLLEINVGLFNRIQIGVKTSPITWFLPMGDKPLKQALWMAQIKAQIWRSPRFKLTADLSYFHVAGVHGVVPRLSMKAGSDKLAFHLSAGAIIAFLPIMEYDAMPGASRCSEETCTDCGGSYDSGPTPIAVGQFSAALEVRIWRYAKLFAEGFALVSPEGGVLYGAAPGIRFHGKGFAADIGLGVMGMEGEVLPLPVLNFSYRW